MIKRFESLDAFRGICAISVVLYHMNISNSITEMDFFNNSDIFVEFFFVLSGFVLAHGYGYKRELYFFPFLISRFFRLYPLHITMLIVVLLIECGKLLAYKYGGIVFNNIPFSGKNSVSEIIPNLLLIQSWLPSSNPISFNGPSWSISVEFYLYIILFVTITLFNKLNSFSWGLISLASFIMITSDIDYLTALSVKGLACFFGGAFTYSVYRNFSELKIHPILGNTVELALILAVFYVVKTDINHKLIIATLLFCFVVFTFSFESGIVSKALKTKPFKVMGKLSYSIYLIHFSILFCMLATILIIQKITNIELAPTIDGERFIDLGNIILNNILVLITLFSVILSSNFTYNKIEIRGQRIGKELLSKINIGRTSNESI